MVLLNFLKYYFENYCVNRTSSVFFIFPSSLFSSPLLLLGNVWRWIGRLASGIESFIRCWFHLSLLCDWTHLVRSVILLNNGQNRFLCKSQSLFLLSWWRYGAIEIAKTKLWSKLQILENFKVQSDQSKMFSGLKINEIQNSNEASESKLRTCPSKIDEKALGPCGSPKNFIWSSFEFILGKVHQKWWF